MGKFAMASGKLIDMGSFYECDVDLEDIAHHLSMIQRFNGALPLGVRYSVAEHCINLVQHAQRVGGCSTLGLRILLLHDASEAYLSDIVGPVKPHIPDYSQLEHWVQKVINKKLINTHALIDDSVTLKQLDKRIVLDEVSHIKPDFLEIYKQEIKLEPLGCYINYNNHPATVKRCFLNLAQQLGVVWKR